MNSLKKFYCRPGISTTNKNKIGMIAIRDIPPNTKILEKPCYNGQWCYTSELIENNITERVINELQDLYRNKKLFMQKENRLYTFIPNITLNEFHGDMFLNHSKNGNVISTKEGYFTDRSNVEGEELLIR
jgi:hypothetical protein